MRGVVMYAPGDVRVEDVEAPQIQNSTDAIIRLSATCICGSDLWPYRGADDVTEPFHMGHEYAGIVEEVGDAVTTIKPGQFVVGSLFGRAQTQRMRVPLADGTLVATPDIPSDDPEGHWNPHAAESFSA